MRTGILFIVIILSSPAFAVLGETMSPGLASRATAISGKSFVKAESTTTKLSVHEFAKSASTKVFAVAWSGKASPDFQALLGSHHAAFVAALKRWKQTHKGHAPAQFEDQGLHIEIAGGMRAQSGRIWILDQLPKDVNSEDLH